METERLVNKFIGWIDKFFTNMYNYLGQIFRWVTKGVNSFPGWMVLILGLWVAKEIFNIKINLKT